MHYDRPRTTNPLHNSIVYTSCEYKYKFDRIINIT